MIRVGFNENVSISTELFYSRGELFLYDCVIRCSVCLSIIHDNDNSLYMIA
jgi:hypothetical protein